MPTPNLPPRHLLPSAVLALLAPGLACAATFTVGQPGDTACSHPSLQAAVNAAAVSPGLDIIRVSAGTYSAQRIQVDDAGDLGILGGWLSCGTPVGNAGSTVISGAGANPAGTVISHGNAGGHLTLVDLTVTAGNGASGGGVFSNGSAGLTLRRVLLANNRANAGGGLSVTGFGSQLKPVLLEGVGFNSNVANILGGGLYALYADVRIGSATEVDYFAGNLANGTASTLGGGAIFAVDSNIVIHATPPVQGPFMDGNLASASGGAIAFLAQTPGFRTLTLMNRHADRPLVLGGNAADRGGALWLFGAGSSGPMTTGATLVNTILEGNDAGEGGSIFVGASDGGHANANSVTMMASSPGQAAPPCPEALRCNRISGSQTFLSSTISVNGAGSLATSAFSMLRGQVLDNFSNSGGVAGGTGFIQFDNSVIAGNTAPQANLMYAVGNTVRILNSTIAGNLIGADEVFTVLLVPGALTVHNSIVFQPGRGIHLLGNSVGVDLRNLLVGSGHGLANLVPRNIQQVFDPLFVNAGQGDYRLQPGSQARDRYTAGGGVVLPAIDLRGAGRPVASPGSPTPYDFGAYEFGAVVDALFGNGFEG